MTLVTKKARLDDIGDSSTNRDEEMVEEEKKQMKKLRILDRIALSNAMMREQKRPVLPEIEPDGIIRWEIDNVSELRRSESDIVEICGVPWKLKVTAKIRAPYTAKTFTVFTHANCESESPFWECRFSSKIIIRNIDPAKSVSAESESTYNYINNKIGCKFKNDETQEIRRSILDPNKGFIDNDKVNVEVLIYVRTFTGMWWKPRFEFSASWDIRSDAAL
ncbi:hypothetical protein PMAYCL1PPCAC_24847, partial [Pristionchus mayeri]